MASDAATTIEVAGTLCSVEKLTAAIRDSVTVEAGPAGELTGQQAIAAVAGVHQSTVSRRLRAGGKLAHDATGRDIESAILTHLPNVAGADLAREYGAEPETAATAAQSRPKGSTPAPNAAPAPKVATAPDDKPSPTRKATKDPTRVSTLLQRIHKPIADVRAAIRDGSLDSVFGVRKAALVLQVFGALAGEGWKTRDALAAAWYVAVVAKEPADTRLHVVEPFVSEFGFDPEPPAAADEALPAPDGEGWLHPVVPLLAALLRRGIHVWLYGEAGHGKSRAARDAARLIGRESLAFACHKYVHTDDALGGKEIENGRTVDREGPWPYAMRRGAVLVLEEPSKAPAGVLAAAHSMLEEREVLLPAARSEDGSPRIVRAAPGFVAVACDNAEAGRDPGRYAAVNYMDPAFLDRWAMIEVGQLPERAELAIMRDALAGALAGGDAEALQVADALQAEEEA